MKAKYICIEGSEGVGKTTQINNLQEYLEKNQKKVLRTSEPGTKHLPLTMDLRGIVLNKKNDENNTRLAREFLNLSIRSIHLEKLIKESLSSYDYIIQDRGILSGLSYATSYPEFDGNDKFLIDLNNAIVKESQVAKDFSECYDKIILLKGNVKNGLDRATAAKQEFKEGDAVESRGSSFLEVVDSKFDYYKKLFKNVVVINIDGKTIDEVFNLILKEI